LLDEFFGAEFLGFLLILRLFHVVVEGEDAESF